MCETNAYIEKEGGYELYLESVDILRPGSGAVYMKNIFGEEKTFKGSIKEISLAAHRITIRAD